MEVAKVTSKGQITIPVSIRRRLEIGEVDRLLFIDRPDGVIMVNPNTFQTVMDDTLASSEKEPETQKALPADSGSQEQIVEEQDEAAKPSASPVSKTKDYDVAALLNEIRSMGSIGSKN